MERLFVTTVGFTSMGLLSGIIKKFKRLLSTLVRVCKKKKKNSPVDECSDHCVTSHLMADSFDVSMQRTSIIGDGMYIKATLTPPPLAVTIGPQ